MKQSVNNVNIEGLVSELNIRDIDKGDKKYIAGTVVVKVPTKDGNFNLIPVDFISADVKKDGTPNQNYARLQSLKTFNSIAALGKEEGATKVQIRSAQLQENLFLPQGGSEVISTIKINSNFFTKITNDTNYVPESSFTVTTYIVKMEDEVKNEELTGRLVVTGAVIGYADKVDIIRFVADEKSNIDFIKSHWKEGDTVRIGGDLRFTEEIIEREEEIGFGEAETRRFTRRTKEFVIKRGSAAGLEDEEAYLEEDIRNGLKARKARMDAILNAPKQAPQKSTTSTTSNDYGF